MVILTSRRNNGYLSLLPMEPLVLHPDLSQQSRCLIAMEFLKELSAIHPYLPHCFFASVLIAMIIVGNILTSLVEAWQAPKMPPKPPAPPPPEKNRYDVLIALIEERRVLKSTILAGGMTWQIEQLEKLDEQISSILEKTKWLRARPEHVSGGLFYFMRDEYYPSSSGSSSG